MKFLARFALALILLSPLSSFAQNAAKENKSPSVMGTWKLRSWQFFKTSRNGEVKVINFCGSEKINGTLIYSEDGYMSAAINCPSHDLLSFASLSKGMLFYSGTYEILENGTVRHTVQNASYAKLLKDTIQDRQITKLTSTELELEGMTSTPIGTFKFKLVWEKAPQRVLEKN